MLNRNMPKFLHCRHISAFVYTRINNGVLSLEYYQSLLLLIVIKRWLNPSEFVIIHVSTHLKTNLDVLLCLPNSLKSKQCVFWGKSDFNIPELLCCWCAQITSFLKTQSEWKLPRVPWQCSFIIYCHSEPLYCHIIHK